MQEATTGTSWLIWALAFPKGGVGPPRALDAGDIDQRGEDDGFVWIHLDRHQPEAEEWLRRESGLDEDASEAMLAPNSRPRIVRQDGRLFMTLRAVNFDAGADRDDFVSVRIWLDDRRLITLRRERARVADDVRAQIEKGHVPKSPGEVLLWLVARVTDRISDFVDEKTDELDEFEDQVLSEEWRFDRTSLAASRKAVVALRRHVAPQRDALHHLVAMDHPALAGDLQVDLGEVTNKLTRLVEDLAANHDRSLVLQDEIANRLAEQANHRIYVLTVLTGIFLPLSLLTGLLGINVAGIPLAGKTWAFAGVCGILLGLGVVELLILRRLRWF